MRIVLLGATGYVGNVFVRRARESFPDVALVVSGRNRTKLAVLQQSPNVRAVHAYEHGEGLNAVLKDADVCVDLSYQTAGIPSTQIRRSHEHAERLVKGCRDHGIQHLIVVGSVAVYGVPVIKHPWPSAPDPAKLGFPSSIYARVKAVVESRASARARQHGVKLALIRSGHIMGAGSKMASNIAGGLLRGDVLLLSQRTGPSNATTVEGLVSSLLHLAMRGWEEPVITANHVNLSGISYDDIVEVFARHMNIHPVVGNAAVSRERLRSRFLRGVRAQEAWLSVLQSYAGWSEGIVSSIKRACAKDKASFAGAVGSGLPSGSSVLPIYVSDQVPHSASICGPLVETKGLDDALEDVRHWMTNSGFDGFIR